MTRHQEAVTSSTISTQTGKVEEGTRSSTSLEAETVSEVAATGPWLVSWEPSVNVGGNDTGEVGTAQVAVAVVAVDDTAVDGEDESTAVTAAVAAAVVEAVAAVDDILAQIVVVAYMGC